MYECGDWSKDRQSSVFSGDLERASCYVICNCVELTLCERRGIDLQCNRKKAKEYRARVSP